MKKNTLPNYWYPRLRCYTSFLAVGIEWLDVLTGWKTKFLKCFKFNEWQRSVRFEKIVQPTASVHQSFSISSSPWLNDSRMFGMISYWTLFKKSFISKVGSILMISVSTSLISVDLNMPPKTEENLSVIERVALTNGLSLSSYCVLNSNSSNVKCYLIYLVGIAFIYSFKRFLLFI